jgi:hypothetical protein
MKIHEIGDMEVPPVVVEAAQIGLNFAIGRYVVAPLLIGVIALIGLIFGMQASAYAIVVVAMGTVVWMVGTVVSTVANGTSQGTVERYLRSNFGNDYLFWNAFYRNVPDADRQFERMTAWAEEIRTDPTNFKAFVTRTIDGELNKR